jgi:hypothetical protein
MWQRFMRRLLKDTKITERFTEHDLRGKVGSDLASIEQATELMAQFAVSPNEVNGPSSGEAANISVFSIQKTGLASAAPLNP